MRVLFSFISFLLLAASFRTEPELSAARILSQMYDSIKNIKTLRQKVIAIERLEDTFNTSRSEIKILNQPKKIYFINRFKKLEVLYNSEISSQKALVKPHIFPYLTLNLDPRGNLMRKNQHYTIHELGYDFIGKSIALTLNKDKNGMY